MTTGQHKCVAAFPRHSGAQMSEKGMEGQIKTSSRGIQARKSALAGMAYMIGQLRRPLPRKYNALHAHIR